jgi:hypothetical protein
MQSQAGYHIGDALIRNPHAPISQVFFKNIKLGFQGLFHIMEGANLNQNVKSLHIGIVTDEGLQTVYKSLCNNKGNLLHLEL